MTIYEYLSRCIACGLSFLLPRTLVRDEVCSLFTRHASFLDYTASVLPTNQNYGPDVSLMVDRMIKSGREIMIQKEVQHHPRPVFAQTIGRAAWRNGRTPVSGVPPVLHTGFDPSSLLPHPT
jgi:hypothetical protein